MRLFEHPVWPYLRPHARLLAGGGAIEFTRIPPDLRRVALGVVVNCAACGEMVSPVRPRGKAGLAYAPVCPKRRSQLCSVSSALAEHWQRIRNEVAPTLGSFDPPGRETALDRRFWEYHEENPAVYEELLALARQARAKGRRGFGIKMIFEVVRWNRFLTTVDPDGWKLNNNFHSRFARLLMANEPDLRGMFELRELRS